MSFEQKKFSPAEQHGATPEQIQEAEQFLMEERGLLEEFPNGDANMGAFAFILATEGLIAEARKEL